jgi:hypothetical protein
MATSSDDDDPPNVMNGNTTPTSSAAATTMPGQQQQQQQHKVFVLESSENNSHLGRLQRFKIQAREVCHSMVCCLRKASSSSKAGGGGEEDAVVGKVKEFRLDPNQGYNTWLYWLSCGLFGGARRQLRRTIGISPNQQLGMYLHWMFRVNFLFLFCVMCIMFFVWVMVFAALIIMAGTMDPQCVRVGGEPFGESDSQFADAFALSWTTFSTVVSCYYLCTVTGTLITLRCMALL